MFVDKYLQSLNTSDLRDDEQHRQTEALAAAALADLSGGSGAVFGSLLARAKFADGVPHKTFEAGNHSLAVLLRAWTKAVIERGLARQWLKIKHEWDIKAAHSMYAKIARVSLAHWLAGQCEECHGTKIAHARACTHCSGTGLEPIQGGAVEREKVADMVSELEGLYQSHSARAGAKLRKAA
jgi:DnaJ-class molecular chaperone